MQPVTLITSVTLPEPGNKRTLFCRGAKYLPLNTIKAEVLMSEREQKIAAFVAIYGVKRLPYMGKHVDLALWEEANRYADAPRFVAPIADSNEDLLITGIDRTRSFWVVR